MLIFAKTCIKITLYHKICNDLLRVPFSCPITQPQKKRSPTQRAGNRTKGMREENESGVLTRCQRGRQRSTSFYR